MFSIVGLFHTGQRKSKRMASLKGGLKNQHFIEVFLVMSEVSSPSCLRWSGYCKGALWKAKAISPASWICFPLWKLLYPPCWMIWHVQKKHLFQIYLILNYVFVSAFEYVHMWQAPDGQAWTCGNPLMLELQAVVSNLMWVQGIELESPTRAGYYLNHWSIFTCMPDAHGGQKTVLNPLGL